MKILYHRRFLKRFAILPPKVKEQFKKRLQFFAVYPHHVLLNNHALHGKYQEFRSINVTGDMHALYKMINGHTVEFVYIDTHENLYG